ncbi:MAG: pyridoxamine 5'-phosphate oxidase family protein [Pseudomonadota bacterium]|nr:pyridoxamine 5'-phosphate oxidase family protein [Pseudomonadota bacterium]
MTVFVSDIAFSPAVKAQQELRGSRRSYQAMAQKRDWRSEIDADIAAFVAERDSFYIATSNASGWPTIQHRGGPRGFLRVMGPRQLGFADFAGNRQYVTIGNLSENPRAMLFLMDYAGRRRIKIWGKARSVEDDEALVASLAVDGYEARIERAILIDVEAIDINCSQHITTRADEATIRQATDGLLHRIAELEAENARLRALPGAAAG